MPIVDVELVCAAAESASLPNAASLASALGRTFGTPPGRTWIRMRTLDATCYAENDAPIPEGDLPVFVTILHARPPSGTALQAEVTAITHAVAAWAGRSSTRVHVTYAPAAAGRQSFGGQLV
jgi:hypothetical protein